ncbi:MAG: exodeoxyribonuclease VII large subunit [Bacteroidetes bacterium]|nr:exodeoxyribonuclease VII large subunit [Bacteroidota bacterium]
MSELITSTKEKFLSLSAISQGIRTAIQSKFGDQLLWIVAEISEMSVRKGHCYLSLVEKLPGNSAPVCEMKGIVWSTKFERIHTIFQKATGNELRSGSVILFQASVRFDVKWGLSLIVEDIEPKYTIGLLQQERDKTIAALREEGIFNNNRLLPFPLVPQRIAAISARDSRGYEDFINKLETNSKGYKFEVDLYPSLLQGEKAAGEMVDRLIRIFNNKEKYDLVVIVRGGGGAIDLNCFNDYRLSRAVARFPIPVLTGIGHTMNQARSDLGVAIRELSYKTQQKIIRGEMLIQEKFKVLHSLPQALLKVAGLKLSRQEGIIQTLDPVNVLKRGFSITLHNGKAIKSAETVQPGAVLKTILYEGTIESEVKGN